MEEEAKKFISTRVCKTVKKVLSFGTATSYSPEAKKWHIKLDASVPGGKGGMIDHVDLDYVDLCKGKDLYESYHMHMQERAASFR